MTDEPFVVRLYSSRVVTLHSFSNVCFDTFLYCNLWSRVIHTVCLGKADVSLAFSNTATQMVCRRYSVLLSSLNT